MEWLVIPLYVMIAIYLFNRSKQNHVSILLGAPEQQKTIGDIGENIIINRLSKLSDDYIVEHNVHLGKTQIDHLVINHTLQVCFVIETKMWGGTITGKSNDTYWQQNINGSIHYFKSPYKQNSYHCNVVRKYYSGYKIYNVLVFVNNKNVPHLRCIVDEDEVREYIIEKSNNIAKKLTLI